jgi:hypothetical protein
MCRHRAYRQAGTAQPGVRRTGRREAGNFAAAPERRRVRKLMSTVAKDRCADPADLFFGTDRGFCHRRVALIALVRLIVWVGNGPLSDQDASARTWHCDRLYRRGGVPSVHIAESDEGLMMRQYRTWTLLALLVLAPAKGQTPDATPRVQGLFRYGPETCKKRCADDAACFNECRQHEITPAELRDIINQQKQQPRK